MKLSTFLRWKPQSMERYDHETFTKEVANYLTYTGMSAQFKKLVKEFEWVFKIAENTSTLGGFEVEVENIKYSCIVPKFIHPSNDGSLRNHGKEYISEPLAPVRLCQSLILLWLALKKLNKKQAPDFSWRTSFHQHIFVMGLSFEEFKSLIILSILFDSVLFVPSSAKRDSGVFCVPSNASTLFAPLHDFFCEKLPTPATVTKLVKGWLKYSSFNLRRMLSLEDEGKPGIGTIEYRHQEGTKHLENLMLWLSMIFQIYNYAASKPFEKVLEDVKQLNNSSQYFKFASNVFGDQVLRELQIADYQPLMYRQVSLVKQVTTPQIELDAPREDSSLMSVLKVYCKKKEEKMQKRKKEHDEWLKKLHEKKAKQNAEWKKQMAMAQGQQQGIPLNMILPGNEIQIDIEMQPPEWNIEEDDGVPN